MFPITHEGTEYLPGQKGTPAPTPPLTCDLCHVECVPTSSITPGYAYLDDIEGTRARLCYKCAANFEKEAMTQTGRTVLYINEKEHRVSNWTGDLSFPTVVIWHGHHNWWTCDSVTFARFIGPDGAVWTGRHLGDNEIIRCKRTKIDPSQARY